MNERTEALLAEIANRRLYERRVRRITAGPIPRKRGGSSDWLMNLSGVVALIAVMVAIVGFLA